MNAWDRTKQKSADKHAVAHVVVVPFFFMPFFDRSAYYNILQTKPQNDL